MRDDLLNERASGPLVQDVRADMQQTAPPSSLWMWCVVVILLFLLVFTTWFFIPAEKVKEWQTGLGAVLGFSGLMTMEAVRLIIQNKRENWNRWLDRASLCHSLMKEIDFLLSRINESKFNLDIQKKASNNGDANKLRKSIYKLISIPEPIMYSKFIEKSFLLPTSCTEAVMDFYVWYNESRRIIDVYLDPDIDHDVDEEDMKAISFTLIKASSFGSMAQDQLISSSTPSSKKDALSREPLKTE